MIYGHGDDIYSHGKEIIINFSSNIYGRQDMSALQKYLCTHINTIHSYPEPDASSLVKLLAAKNDVKPENVSVTNGATEAIYLIAQTFAYSESAIIYPTFSEYGDACDINKHAIEQVASLNDVPDHTDLIWICNPNNPTGAVTDKQILEAYIESHPEKYIIIDQSYEYFTNKELFTPAEATHYKNVILLHSMTKHHAIPGLRLGYITAHADTLKLITKYSMPWSVNALAIEAGKFLLTNNLSTINIADYLKETTSLQNALKEIQGIRIFPTDTHFFLCKLEKKKASELKKYLIDTHGILIRDAANFYGLDEYYFRIATQSQDENETLMKALNQWI